MARGHPPHSGRNTRIAPLRTVAQIARAYAAELAAQSQSPGTGQQRPSPQRISSSLATARRRGSQSSARSPPPPPDPSQRRRSNANQDSTAAAQNPPQRRRPRPPPGLFCLIPTGRWRPLACRTTRPTSFADFLGNSELSRPDGRRIFSEVSRPDPLCFSSKLGGSILLSNICVGGNDAAEAESRAAASRTSLDVTILLKLQRYITRNNPYSQFYRRAREVLAANPDAGFVLRHVQAPVGADQRVYNAPQTEEVGIVIDRDDPDNIPPRDIVLQSMMAVLSALPIISVDICRFAILFSFLTASRDGSTVGKEMEAEIALSLNIRFVLTATKAFWNPSAMASKLLGEGSSSPLPSQDPRNMKQLYQDAMALVRVFGRPSLFITMTANSYWPEVVAALKEHQIPSDRPDLVTRLFRLKLENMVEDVIKRDRLGEVAAWVYTIEFQKRGLPHAHFVVFLKPGSVPRTPEAIDCLVTAEIPDPEREPRLHKIVKRCMLHGPCNPNSMCWKNGSCGKNFPKEFLPYGIAAVKYLFKYIAKGPDRSAMQMEEGDETRRFINGRYGSVMLTLASHSCVPALPVVLLYAVAYRTEF
ncbi:hypothetical protein PSTT_10476 [Puccinia striiformis]|uniref:Helitron helicase-like domain-containing protein n=1 Tax=Puccinia striiformis TaxID=27350 RepID=A0A2S4V485_9BASI|nr:hypothetical protein PSTT_10476 [Puccinia striiformis]